MDGDTRQPNTGQSEPGWHYTPEGNGGAPGQAQTSPVPPVEKITWTASEFITRHKGLGWYGALALGVVVATGLAYVISRDMITAGAIAIALILFGVAATHKPRTLQYELDDRGLTAGQKFYAYGDFKSFSVVREGAFSSISLLSMKRFMPPLSVYYDPQDEERIVALIANHLPLEDRPQDAADRLMSHLRF